MMVTKQCVLLFLSSAAYLSSKCLVDAFSSKPHIATPATSLRASNNDDTNRRALNFPPISERDSEETKAYVNAGVSPRVARVISPLQALLSMPIILNASPAGAAEEDTFEAAVADYFPKSQPSSKTLSLVSSVLQKRAKAEDTLFGTSICPDEVNSKPGFKSFSTALQDNVSKQNGIFTLGGLAGLPFVGVSGMQAFLSHCPEEGRVVIFFGPHVGVSEEGVVGKVARLGKSKLSGACGAAVGAYKAIIAEAKEELAAESKQVTAINESLDNLVLEQGSSDDVLAARKQLIARLQKSLDKIAEQSASLEDENLKLKEKLKKRSDTADYQEEYIINRLRPKIKSIDFTDDNRAVAYVTKQVYGFIVDMLMAELQYCWKNPSFWDGIEEVTLIGGILINRGQGLPPRDPNSADPFEDYFQPLKFETYTYDQGIKKLDLYTSTFGRIPFGYSLFTESEY